MQPWERANPGQQPDGGALGAGRGGEGRPRDQFLERGSDEIFTKIDVLVDDAFKGEERARIEVLQLGGVVGNVKVTVEGAFVWRTGDEVLLFLEPYPGGMFQVEGMSQGRIARRRVTA